MARRERASVGIRRTLSSREWWRRCHRIQRAIGGSSNRGRVIVRGTYASVVGRISMDLTLIDVTDVPKVATGDQVTLLGEDGSLAVATEDIAKTAGTLSYEITCGISQRVPRSYSPKEQR